MMCHKDNYESSCFFYCKSMCNLTKSNSVPLHSLVCLLCRIQCLTKSRQKDKQNCSLLEKKIRMETEGRVAVEKQTAEVRAQKFDEATMLLRSASHR